MTTPSSLTKVCSICGQLKPLSAFLQFSKNKTEYGAICSDCRKAGAGEPTINNDDDTISTTGAIIDSKSKVQSDTEKKQEHDKTEESYHEERNEKEAENALETEKSKETIKQEMKHRKTYLDKPRFLSQKQATTGESRWAQQKTVEQAHQQTEFAREEQKKDEIDLTAPVEDTRIAGKIKYSGDTFKRFTALVKKGSPIGTAFEQKNQKNDASENETPSEYIEKNWGPKR